ncbi:hypothetical protein [Nostoc sp. UHCC 0870]|uniref:hypothetical protein n=1 Tax=Nostoc sp. UHCC 0870 TaxID=2914041 RepID=UPI001EE08AD6|nr:hypothetical protein [Nostoc sp. UHCC 0870]UKO99956.1 hypothetical protein L6494_09735 [Nostoc sp. UHCC 0870]
MYEHRSTTFNFKTLSASFNKYKGYYNLDNLNLGNALETWNLLEETNREDINIIANYQKWSFTASFLQMLNAWQWFFSGILLGRQAYLPAQILQMYYYSIFFSYGAFLSANFKGNYSLKVEIGQDRKVKTKNRKEVWLSQETNNKSQIMIKDQGSGGEHEIRAKWFYEVFKNWDFKDDHPQVLSFIASRDFHSDSRNFYTYSLSDIAEELYEVPKMQSSPSNDILISLWNREIDWVEYFPEEFWALEHIKVAVDLHTRLLKGYDKESPYTQQQILLLENLCNHHIHTGLIEIIRIAMPTILQMLK